jgi:hypothetical protein
MGIVLVLSLTVYLSMSVTGVLKFEDQKPPKWGGLIYKDSEVELLRDLGL